MTIYLLFHLTFVACAIGVTNSSSNIWEVSWLCRVHYLVTRGPKAVWQSRCRAQSTISLYTFNILHCWCVICGDTKEEHDISILRLRDRQCGLDMGWTVLIARDQISSQLSLPSDSLIWAHLWSFKLQTANKTMCDKQLLCYCKWPSIVEVVACSHELLVLYHSKWTSSWKPKVECSTWPPVQRRMSCRNCNL